MRKIYWATRGETEVVLCVHGPGDALDVIFPTVGIKRAVAEVIVCRGVESVRAGFHCEAHDTVAGFSKLGREIALQDLKLLDRIARNTLVPLRIRRNQ